jgi:hypothetical protein
MLKDAIAYQTRSQATDLEEYYEEVFARDGWFGCVGQAVSAACASVHQGATCRGSDIQLERLLHRRERWIWLEQPVHRCHRG